MIIWVRAVSLPQSAAFTPQEMGPAPFFIMKLMSRLLFLGIYSSSSLRICTQPIFVPNARTTTVPGPPP